MIDNFSLLISHGLLALLCWRLLTRPDLDKEVPPSPSTGLDGTDESRPSAAGGPTPWRRMRPAGREARDA